MQPGYLRIEFYVADADEAEKLSKLAQQLSGETVIYSRGAQTGVGHCCPTSVSRFVGRHHGV